MRNIRVVFGLALALGLILVVAGCGTRNAATPSSPQTQGDPQAQGGFYQVVGVGDKELTFGPPTPVGDTRRVVAITVKNTGAIPITLAELQFIFTQTWSEEYLEWYLAERGEYPDPEDYYREERATIKINELPPGQVRTVYWNPAHALSGIGELRAEVTNLE